MNKEIEVYLEDILNCIRKIEVYTQDTDIQKLSQDEKTQDAIIRNFEVIGEAVNRLPTSFFTTHLDFPTKETISMRNFLIHDYDSIDLEIIWKTLKQDLPKLRDIIDKIVNK